jgi:hypothetical protein
LTTRRGTDLNTTYVFQPERLDQLGEQLGRPLHHPEPAVLFVVGQLNVMSERKTISINPAHPDRARRARSRMAYQVHQRLNTKDFGPLGRPVEQVYENTISLWPENERILRLRIDGMQSVGLTDRYEAKERSRPRLLL